MEEEDKIVQLVKVPKGEITLAEAILKAVEPRDKDKKPEAGPQQLTLPGF